MKKCSIKDCSKPAAHRGLCVGHYSAAARMVRLNRTDWLTLQRRGLATATKRGRPLGNIFVS